MRPLHSRDFHLARARNHAFRRRGRELIVHKLYYVADRETVRAKNAFRAAFIAAAREQFERPNSVGL
jgi:hypothetical protein